MDFPEAYESLRYGLAARLGDEFPIDPQRQAMLEQKRRGYFTAMRQTHIVAMRPSSLECAANVYQ